MKTHDLESASAKPEREGSHVFWQRLKVFLGLSSPSPVDPSTTESASTPRAEREREDAESREALEAREFALSPHIQELWRQIFSLVGVPASSPEEFPGLFRVTPGMQEGEAMVHIDVPSEPYLDGEPPRMQRIVTLTVKMDHDYRRLGDEYYCIDCVPTNETRH